MKKEDLVKGNATINLVSSLASLIGPVVGGAIYSFFGLTPILYVSILCFAFSAIMELFLQIPFEKRKENISKNIIKTGYFDLKESMIFIYRKQPIILKASLIMALANLFFSSLVLISLPVMITQMLGFSAEEGNRLYGYAEGALAAGCLIGGILAGAFSQKQKPDKQYVWLILSSMTLLPIAGGFCLNLPAKIIYIIILICCLVMVTISSLFSVQMMSYLQMLTPEHMMGKIIACAMCICMCAQPVGQSIYGILFEKWSSYVAVIFTGAFLITTILSISSRKIFQEIDCTLKQRN